MLFSLLLSLPKQPNYRESSLTPPAFPVPNATVNLQNSQTGAIRRVTSNQQGLYSAPALAPGSYDVSVQATGFASVHQNTVVLEVDQRARLDFTLTDRQRHETMTVEGSAPLLNASDASVSTVIGNRFVENMPLNGRSFSSLIELTPGVVLTPANLFEQGQFSVNGQRPDANYFMVDGVSANMGNAGSGGLMYQGGAGEIPGHQCVGRNEQSGLARCARGVSHSDLHLCAGIRPHSGRASLGGDEVRHEYVSRHRVRIFPQ